MPGQCKTYSGAFLKHGDKHSQCGRVSRRWINSLLILCLTVAASPTLATDLSEKLKAVYIANIARFASWPTEKSNISLCIYADSQIYTQTVSLDNISIGASRRLKVISNPADPTVCKLIYWDKNTISLRAYEHNSNILEISDMPNAESLGIDIELFVIDNKLQFSISHANLANSAFEISSKLLRLSKSRTDQ